MKHYEKQTFGQRSPSLNEMIPCIGAMMDRRFLERKLLVGNKRIKYFHKVPIFQDALNEASWQLNPVGIKLLFECIKLAEKCWESMQMED